MAFNEEQIVINDNNSINRSYLKLAGPNRWMLAAAVVAILICASLWFFCGEMTQSVTGYCEPSKTSAVFMLPMYYCDEISAGDTIWIGNHSGKIEKIYDDSYLTYESIKDSADIVFRNFYNSGKCDEDMAYVLCNAKFEESISGINEYKIITGTVKPYQMFTGGVENGQ